jgi:hypothetical protein
MFGGVIHPFYIPSDKQGTERPLVYDLAFGK